MSSSEIEVRDFADMFANYPSLQHRLTLVDAGSPEGKHLRQPSSSTYALMPHLIGAPLTKATTNNSLNGLPSGNHKPSRSDEAERRRDPRDPRARPRPRPNGPKEELDIFASPEKRERRPRRNSESSVLSKTSTTEEERKRRERRRREADRGSSSKDRSGSKARSTRRKPRGMDLIDQLDQTGIYGAGCKSLNHGAWIRGTNEGNSLPPRRSL